VQVGSGVWARHSGEQRRGMVGSGAVARHGGERQRGTEGSGDGGTVERHGGSGDGGAAVRRGGEWSADATWWGAVAWHSGEWRR
jgi:hypothetical protein